MVPSRPNTLFPFEVSLVDPASVNQGPSQELADDYAKGVNLGAAELDSLDLVSEE